MIRQEPLYTMVRDDRDGRLKRRFNKDTGREITNDEWKRAEWQDVTGIQDRDLQFVKVRDRRDG